MKSPSVEPVVRSRLLPRISFRMMFATTTLAAFLAALARWADSGNEFAIGILGAAGFIAGCFLCFVTFFLVSWSAVIYRVASRVVALVIGCFLVAAASLIGLDTALSFAILIAGVFFFVSGVTLFLVRGPDDEPTPSSPFAANQLPPQILPPREPTK